MTGCVCNKGKYTDGRSGRRGEAFAAATSHEAGRAVIVCEVGHPIVVCQAAIAAEREGGVHGNSSGVERGSKCG